MKKIGVWAAVIALLAGVLVGCGSNGGGSGEDASDKYIEIKQYDGLEIDRPDNTEITDEDVQMEIDSQLESLQTNETEVPDRPIKKGDTIILDCSAKDKDGKVLSGTELSDYELEIGSGAFIPGWEDACIGKPYGKAFTFDLQFPEDYGSEEISGKNATWTVTAKERVTGKKKVELTDETVKKLSSTAKTVKEYKKEVKEKLTDQLETTNRQILEMEVWEALLDQTEVIKYPEGSVEEQVEQVIDSYKEMAERSNMSFEDYLSQMGLTEESLRAESKESAQQAVKRELATDLLIEELGLKLSDKDYTEKYKELAKRYGYDDDYESFIAAAGKETAKKLAKQSIVSDWLIEHAKQVEPKSSDAQDTDQDAEPQQEDKAAGDSQK